GREAPAQQADRDEARTAAGHEARRDDAGQHQGRLRQGNRRGGTRDRGVRRPQGGREPRQRERGDDGGAPVAGTTGTVVGTLELGGGLGHVSSLAVRAAPVRRVRGAQRPGSGWLRPWEDGPVDAVFAVPEPRNEPLRGYAPGTPERESLARRIGELAAERIDLTMTIAGRERRGAGAAIDVVQPHKHAHVLGVTHNATNDDAAAAVAAAREAAPEWRDLPYTERSAVFLRAADLLAGPWRDTLNAATMLGQSKSIAQAEIDAACEFIDFLRWNVHFGHFPLADPP